MQELIKQNGAVDDTIGYLGRSGKTDWHAVPSTRGTRSKVPARASIL